MLILAGTSDLVTLVASVSGSIDVHASWVDNLSGTITPSRTNTATIAVSGATTIVGSPASLTQRNVKFISIRNTHASQVPAVTVKHTDGSNNLELFKVTLQPGEELEFSEGIWQPFLASGALKTNDSTNVSFTGGVMSNVDIITKAGTAAGAGFTVASGTLETVALAGDVEYDGVALYMTPVASERGVLDTEQFITMQGGSFTLVSQAPPQKMFNSPTSGQVTVGGGRTYLFECQFDLSSMSATSSGFGFALGGTASYTYSKWWSRANKAALATQAAPQGTMNINVTSNTAIVSGTTSTVGWAFIQGILRINAGGTIVPQVSLGVSAAAVVGRDSYFRIWPLGNSTVISVGNWS